MLSKLKILRHHPIIGRTGQHCLNTSVSSFRISDKCHNFASITTSSGKLTNAFVFDIDGVLLHHQQALPRAKETLDTLRKNNVPFILLTNNGGKTEINRAKAIQNYLGLDFGLDPKHLIMSHTPMIEEALKYKNDHVLVAGHGDIQGVALGLGLKNAITIDDLLSHNHDIYPAWNHYEVNVLKREILPLENLHYSNIKFKAVFVLHDSFFVMRDLQTIIDVLRSNGTIGQVSASNQDIPLYMSHSDLLYSSLHTWPRFGQGAFKICLQSTYKEMVGRDLVIQQYGKPEKKVYDYAWKILNDQAKSMGYDGISNAFCIGDNPATDILGANNAGDHYTSVLVRTGVFKGEGNDALHPADHVVNNVGDFVVDEYFSKFHF